jgi:uncharacterized SAM-binding protein YcdF (DUF218 family)
MKRMVLRFIIGVFSVLFILVIIEGIYFYSILTKEFSFEKADLIAVFNGDNERTKEGFKLAESGYAPYLTISPAFEEKLEIFKKKYGTANSNVSLIVEPRARTTFENAVHTKEIISTHHFRSVILVTSFYHMPRSYFLLRTMLIGSNVKISICPVPCETLTGSNWFQSFKGRKLIFNEMIKVWASMVEMGMYAVTGDLPESNIKQSPAIKFLKSILLLK